MLNANFDTHQRVLRAFVRRAAAALVTVALVLAPAAQADRTRLRPGWNMFSPQQDVELGQQASKEAEKQFPMLNDAKVDAYLKNLGLRLAAKAPGEKYPYQFRAVNDRAINAFALPGGFVFVNRGTIEAADNEAQLAGVMGHEIGHVALRHGTNQASKAQLAQAPLAILGGVLGSDSIGAVLTQVAAGGLVGSVLLKYSRDAERQADLMGTQILYDLNYDPRAMAQFFEKLQAQGKSGGKLAEFFSNHPNPENRVAKTMDEVERLGGPPKGYKTDSSEFREIKKYVLSLPAPPKAGQGGTKTGSSGSRSGKPELPSDRFRNFENSMVRLQYPDNWQANGQGDAAVLLPQGGAVDDGRGHQALAYGAMVVVFEPHNDRGGQITLEDATDQLIESLHQSNPNMRVTRQHERVRIGGQRGLSVVLSNDSPVGGKEIDWLVTVLRPKGLLYIVFVAPEKDFDDYNRAFEAIYDSVRFPASR